MRTTFHEELSQVLTETRSPRPSRVKLATSLERIAKNVCAAPRKAPAKKGPAKKKAPPPEAIAAGQVEEGGLDNLSEDLQMALKELGNLAEEVEVNEKEYDKPWPRNIDEFQRDLSRAVSGLSHALAKAEKVTNETDLTKAVQDFAEAIYDVDPKIREEPGTVPKAQKALKEAISLIPKALTGPGALGKLRQSFALIVDSLDSLGSSKLKAPAIPKALDPEDPRQMSLFASSGRISNPQHLEEVLHGLRVMASKPNTSREFLAEALYQVADNLRNM